MWKRRLVEINTASKTKDVCLVHMPVALTTVPSFSLGLFKALLNERGIPSTVIYNNLRFLEKFDANFYAFLERSPANHLAGEFLFGKAVGWKPAKDDEDYYKLLRETWPCSLSILPVVEPFWRKMPQMRDKAVEFISDAADEVLSFRPKIVACSSMFQQNMASLALLRRVKEKSPDIITLIGGPNCMGESSTAMAESIPWLDYVFSGEADEVFADFCAALLSDGKDIPEERLPYGAVKKGMNSREKAPFRVSKNLDSLPTPDYSDYFAALENSPLKENITPGLLVEGSRGCWWGEKKACSFCGLGGGVSPQIPTKITRQSFKRNKGAFGKARHI